METLQETLLSAIRYQIKFDNQILEQFFKISDILYGKNSDFKKNMTDFIENKNNSQMSILSQFNHPLAKDIKRLGKAQLDVYIAKEKCDVVKNYFISLKRTIETNRHEQELKCAEYILIQKLGDMHLKDISFTTLRNAISSMLLFYDLINYKREMSELALAIDLVGV